MKTAVVGITKHGTELACRIGRALAADIYVRDIYIRAEWPAGRKNLPAEPLYPVTENLGALAGRLFKAYEGIIFIMACGIVVRCLAPHVRDKTIDPAIVVTDENGQHVISLLSGHLGGANKLARTVAGITGGTAVITTATDVRQVPAFDEVARENDCCIENFTELKSISSALVNDGAVSLYTDLAIDGEWPARLLPYNNDLCAGNVVVISNRTDLDIKGDKVLMLRPRNLILGIGCRKGTPCNQIEEAVTEFMQRNRKSLLAVRKVASLDLKKEEAGLVAFCRKNRLAFQTLSCDVIKSIEHNFLFSAFVKAHTGVGSVAEACAVASGDQSRLICPKTIFKGITLALAEEEKVIRL